jgi:hypothetical protein
MNSIFSKSYDDLSLLNNNNKYIFVFDFDLTLTLKSSDGLNYNSNFIELFDNNDKLNKLKSLLNKIKSLNSKIYINTRAVINNIKYILNKIGIEVGNNKIIENIYGSENITDINNPLTLYELKLYNLSDISNIKVLWGIKKVLYLNKICEINKIQKNNILFFDDSNININTAKINGYYNSFLIGSNDSGIYGLDYLLIKIEQILEIIS